MRTFGSHGPINHAINGSSYFLMLVKIGYKVPMVLKWLLRALLLLELWVSNEDLESHGPKKGPYRNLCHLELWINNGDLLGPVQ